jgi:hypothetical protein
MAVAAAGCSGVLPRRTPTLEPFSRYLQRQSTAGPLNARFLGTSSILFQDSETTILSDGFVSRPSRWDVLRPIAPDQNRGDDALRRLGVTPPRLLRASLDGRGRQGNRNRPADAVYNLLDLTPEGRDDWYAKLIYPEGPHWPRR